MYKLAICDDDLNCAKAMCRVLESEFINQNFNCEIICVTSNQEEIYSLVKSHQIDILFLDIDFKDVGKNGIDFANELRDLDNNFYLIFLSAHIKYMPLSFISKTFDFLVKPTHRNVISLLVERLKKDLHQNTLKFLEISKNIQIKIDTITYIEKEVNKCIIHTSNTVLEINSTLDNLLSILPSHFVKCHKSIIINKNKVSVCNNKKNIIIFENGETCPKSTNFILRMEDN